MEHSCIYCGALEDLSESDIVPDALTNARILNKNVCRIAHNNKFSDLFESKVITSLAFITNVLDIKSGKGKTYAKYPAIMRIAGIDYGTVTYGDNCIFDGRVLTSLDKKHKISTFERMARIAGDPQKVEPLDVNNIEIEKRVKICNEIFFDVSMYRMLSKIAYEWYCARNDIVGVHDEFENIIAFITQGRGTAPVSIIQHLEIYEMLEKQVNFGSHTLIAYETSRGSVEVIISLFGILMYRVVIANVVPANTKYRILYTELRIDSNQENFKYESDKQVEESVMKFFASKEFMPIEIGDFKVMVPSIAQGNTLNIMAQITLINLVRCFDQIRDDAYEPNEKINDIFHRNLKSIIQSSTIQKKSIKRFVSENFFDDHKSIILNPKASNKRDIVLFYSVYLVGLTEIDNLNDEVFQSLLRKGLPGIKGLELNVTDQISDELMNRMLEDCCYSAVLEKGAERIKNW